VVSLSDPTLYRLITFHVPNLVSLFHSLNRTKASVPVRGKCSCFVTRSLFTVRNCQHLAQPPVGGPPLVGCSRLLIQYIRSYPTYLRPFLHRPFLCIRTSNWASISYVSCPCTMCTELCTGWLLLGVVTVRNK